VANSWRTTFRWSHQGGDSSEFVNQSPLQNTCEATDGLTLFRVTSCVDSVHKNQCTNDEFFTASQCIRELVDVHYPHAPKIRLVLDNLNTHTGASLYEAFPPEEARRILERLEFHYTPKHASWLNMAEIEIGIMNNGQKRG